MDVNFDGYHGWSCVVKPAKQKFEIRGMMATKLARDAMPAISCNKDYRK